MPRVLFLPKDLNAHTLWRMVWICRELSARGFIADWTMLDQSSNFEPLIRGGRYNIVVTPRMTFAEPGMEGFFLQQLRNDGLLWVYELDDDVLSPAIVDHQIKVFDSSQQVGALRLEQERQNRTAMVRRADGVIVSTNPLGAIARQYTDAPVLTVPNAIDLPWFMTRVRDGKRYVPGLTVGWFGGARQAADLEPVAEAWGNLSRRFPEVRFVVYGEYMRVLLDAVPEAQRAWLPWVEFDKYPEHLLNIDIGCCSVAPTPWNACRSPDKFFEYTAAGAACVASPALYGPVVTDGLTALVAETVREWEDAIAGLIRDPELRWNLNTNALSRVAEHHSVQATWQHWTKAFVTILEQSSL